MQLSDTLDISTLKEARKEIGCCSRTSDSEVERQRRGGVELDSVGGVLGCWRDGRRLSICSQVIQTIT